MATFTNYNPMPARFFRVFIQQAMIQRSLALYLLFEVVKKEQHTKKWQIKIYEFPIHLL